MLFIVEEANTFHTTSDSALSCILTLLADNLYDLYMDYTNPTELWDALEHKFVVSEVGRLLYTCEQFYDNIIDAAKSIVAQAHEMQLLAGKIASLGCTLPDSFVAAGIIAKLLATWRDLTTTLKHKREDISAEYLFIALDVEEKARAKDAPSRCGREWC